MKRPDRVYVVSRKSGSSDKARNGPKTGKTKLVDPRLKADKRGSKADSKKKSASKLAGKKRKASATTAKKRRRKQ